MARVSAASRCATPVSATRLDAASAAVHWRHIHGLLYVLLTAVGVSVQVGIVVGTLGKLRQYIFGTGEAGLSEAAKFGGNRCLLVLRSGAGVEPTEPWVTRPHRF